eukprot:1077882-Prorocentrum_minimum.AAC.3
MLASNEDNMVLARRIFAFYASQFQTEPKPDLLGLLATPKGSTPRKGLWGVECTLAVIGTETM